MVHGTSQSYEYSKTTHNSLPLWPGKGQGTVLHFIRYHIISFTITAYRTVSELLHYLPFDLLRTSVGTSLHALIAEFGYYEYDDTSTVQYSVASSFIVLVLARLYKRSDRQPLCYEYSLSTLTHSHSLSLPLSHSFTLFTLHSAGARPILGTPVRLSCWATRTTNRLSFGGFALAQPGSGQQ